MKVFVKDIYSMPTSIMYKRLYILGIAAYIIMLLFSILFYKERIILLDAAFNIFYIIKHSGFCIPHYRFGDALPQILPVIAIKTGQSFNIILGCYSAGYITYYLATYLVCGSILKRYDLALVILLLNILFVSETFYYIASPLTEAIVLMIAQLTIIAGKELKTTSALTWIKIWILGTTLAFFHPLILFVILFTAAFFIMRRPAITDNKLIYVTLAVYIAGVVVKMIFFKDPYESHSASGLKNFITLFPDYFTLFSNKRFLHDCLTKYYWIPILFSGIVILYTRRREYRKLFFFTACFWGYLMLVNISYPTPATPEFYIENLYLPLSIFLALPFVFDVLPVLATKKLALPVVALIILSGCGRIYAAHHTYTARLALERRYLDKYRERKVIVKVSRAETDTLQMLWGTAYETLLLSESEQGRPASVIIDANTSRLPWPLEDKRSLMVNWDRFPYKDLNPKYFQFTDTVSGYVIETPNP